MEYLWNTFLEQINYNQAFYNDTVFKFLMFFYIVI